jgi:hypothetical protein
MPQGFVAVPLGKFTFPNPEQNCRTPSLKDNASIRVTHLPQRCFDLHVIFGDHERIEVKLVSAAIKDRKRVLCGP